MATFTVTRRVTVTEQIEVTASTKEDAISQAKGLTTTPSVTFSASGVTVTAIPSGTTVGTKQHWKARTVST